MKHLYPFILLLLISALSFNSKAQVTITHNHMPEAGDTARYSIAIIDTSSLFNYQKNGANQVWHFDSLKAERQNIRKFYNSSSLSSYSINNKIAEKIADTVKQQGITITDLYEFYNVDSNAFVKNQRAGTIQTGIFPLKITPTYTDVDEIYQFPLNYNDRDSSSFKFSFNNSFPAAYYGSEGYRLNEVDGWGTVHTPFGNFNCIRVITDIVSYDSISFSNNNFGTNNHIREYKWLTPQLSIPALKISGNVIAGAFIPTTIEYRDSARNVPTIFAPLAIFSASPRNINVGDTVLFSNNSISIDEPTHKWSISPNNFNYINGTNSKSEAPEVVFTKVGDYDVQLIVSNSHGKDSLLRKKYIQVNSPTSIIENQMPKSAIKVFPNPVNSSQSLTVKGSLAFDAITVYDLNGKLLYEKTYKKRKKQRGIALPTLKSGQYLIQLTGKKNYATIQFIILE